MKTSTCSFVINIQSFSPGEPQCWCTSENNRTLKLSRVLDWRWRWFRYFISEITERERWELMRSRSHQMARSPGLVTLRSTYSQIFSTRPQIFSGYSEIFSSELRDERWWDQEAIRCKVEPGLARSGHTSLQSRDLGLMWRTSSQEMGLGGRPVSSQHYAHFKYFQSLYKIFPCLYEIFFLVCMKYFPSQLGKKIWSKIWPWVTASSHPGPGGWDWFNFVFDHFNTEIWASSDWPYRDLSVVTSLSLSLSDYWGLPRLGGVLFLSHQTDGRVPWLAGMAN